MVVLIGSAAAQEELWTLRLPDTTVLPSYLKATWLSRMGERHGGSHLGLQDYTANIPIADGRRSHIGKCWINVQGNATVTLLDVGGELDLRRDEMFVFSLPITLVYPLRGKEGQRLMFTVMPRYAGDADCAAHAWDLSFVLDYMVRRSERLTYSLGLAVSPRFAEYAVFPTSRSPGNRLPSGYSACAVTSWQPFTPGAIAFASGLPSVMRGEPGWSVHRMVAASSESAPSQHPLRQNTNSPRPATRAKEFSPPR